MSAATREGASTTSGPVGLADALGEDGAGTARILDFVRPIIGFPASHLYELRELGGGYAPFLALGSVEQVGLMFIAVAPGLLFPDYVLEIPAPDVTLLGLATASDVDVLALVTRRPGKTPTVNLLGPIVADRVTGRALQVVLQDSPYGVAVPVDAATALATSVPMSRGS
jgi:flagellar assembly factor FliW